MGENKYQNGKIYKIVDVGYNSCYIGSTCESLSQRMARHRNKYLYGSERDKGRRINSLFDEFGVENCKIELVEEYPCNNKMELLRQEGHHIRENECVNKIVSGRTNKEYRDEFKEHLQKKAKEHYYDNWEYKQQQKKVYKDLNKDKIKQISKDYWERKREELLEKKICECGKIYTLQHKKRHEKSQKHQNYLKQKSETKEEEK